MPEPRLPGTLIRVQYLPAAVVEYLDKRFGELLAKNGGFADWLLKIDHGVIKYIESKEKEFLEPAHEAKKQPYVN